MKPKQKITLLIHAVIIFLILFFAISPLVSVLIAGEVANLNGCQLDEGSVHACVVNGQDLGETLYTMEVMGWFMFLTVPVGLGAVVVYLIVLVGFTLARRAARNRARDPLRITGD
jgi:ABC-type Fe3+ transport system permease subunit